MEFNHLTKKITVSVLAMTLMLAVLPSFGQNTKAINAGNPPLTKAKTAKVQLRGRNTSPFDKLQSSVKTPRLQMRGKHQSARKSESETTPVFQGNAVYYDGWSENGNAIVQFASGQESLTTIANNDAFDSSCGGIKANGKFYCAYQTDMLGATINVGRVFDADTWDSFGYNYGMDNNMLATALTQDPTDGKIYGCFYNSDMTGYELGTMDITTTTRTSTICKLSHRYVLMGIMNDGTMYAVDAESNYYRVDKTTGDAENIGFLGLDLTYTTGGFVDTDNDIFYIAVSNDYENSIYQMVYDEDWGYYPDWVCDIPENAQLTTLWKGDPLADDGAPAEPTDLAANFEGPSLSGAITFTAPTMTYAGEDLTSELTYFVVEGENQLATGTAQSGEAVIASVIVEGSGQHTFTVYLSNEVGDGAKAKLKEYVGYDAPYRVENVTATRTGNTNVVEWSAAKRGANGGYFDPSLVTYEVTRMPDNVVVATGLTDTTYTDNVAVPEELTVYLYQVRACQEGQWSSEGEPNSVPLGAISLPFQATFDTYEDLEKFTIIDANNDGKHWRWDQSGAAKIYWNSDLDMDDWMITPALKLEKGKKYHLTFDARCEGSDVPERIEVKLGNAPTAEAMTEVVCDPIVVAESKLTTHEYEIIPTESGIQYVGFHGISDKDMYTLYVDNINIETGVSTTSPAKPEADYTPDYNGASKLTLHITAPTLDVDGNPLNGLSKLEVRSTESVLKTFENVTPGQALDCDLEFGSSGMMTFFFAAYSDDGTKGAELSKNIYVGTNYGGTPENVTFTEEGNTGNVTLTWDYLDKDIEGKSINPSLISYVIYDNTGSALGETSENTFSLDALGSRTQRFVNYLIVAKTTRGENTETPGVTEMIPVGTPYEIPFVETLENGILAHSYGQEGQGYWGLYPLSETSYIFEYAGDNTGDVGTLMSGKIDLSKASHPYLNLMVYAYDGSGGQSANTNQLKVLGKKVSDTSWTEVKTISLADGNGWVTYLIDMSAFKGETMQFALQAVANKSYYSIYVDGLNLKDRKAFDMGNDNLMSAERAEIGSTLTLYTTISNEGYKDADGYSVNLYRDGELIATKAGEKILAGHSAAMEFNDEVSALFDSEVSYTTTIDWASDENPDNDESNYWYVKVPHADAPAITDLTGEISGNNVVLNWSKPDIDGLIGPTTETFEGAESFAIDNVEGWNFIDGDGGHTYGLESEFPNAYDPKAYIVFDSSYEGINLGFDMVSGTKCLASFASLTGANDDWAISPALSGEEQTISFYARSITDTYGLESFEIYETTSDAETLTADDFELIGDAEVPSAWTEYTCKLSKGCTHFAIRCTSADRLALMLDNVTFIAADAQQEEIAGYNVYRDGTKLNATPVTECTYTDSRAETADYYVTVVYQSLGESLKSNLVRLQPTGINSVGAEVNTTYYTTAGIRLPGAPTAPGVYVKTVNGKSQKMMVK